MWRGSSSSSLHGQPTPPCQKKGKAHTSRPITWYNVEARMWWHNVTCSATVRSVRPLMTSAVRIHLNHSTHLLLWQILWNKLMIWNTSMMIRYVTSRHACMHVWMYGCIYATCAMYVWMDMIHVRKTFHLSQKTYNMTQPLRLWLPLHKTPLTWSHHCHRNHHSDDSWYPQSHKDYHHLKYIHNMI